MKMHGLSGLLLALLLWGGTPGICAQSASLHAAQDARAYEQSGDLQSASAAWHELLTAHPRNAEALAHLGMIAAHEEHYTEAIVFYRKSLAADPAQQGVRLNLGLAQFKSGALKDAVATFSELEKKLPAHSPETMRVTTLLAMAHYGLGEYGAAVPYLRKITEADPQNLPYRMLLDQSCLWSKQYKCVLDVYKEILSLNAESAEADMLAGEAYDEEHNIEDATRQFRAAAKLNPHQPLVHFGLGYLLWRQKQYAEAASEFATELDAMPQNADALALLGDCTMQMGHPDQAMPLLESAVHLNAQLERPHMDLALLYIEQKKNADALRELLESARIAPGDVEVHWHLARLYQSLGRRDEAKAEFAKTQSLHKAENDSIVAHMHAAQDKGPAQTATPLQDESAGKTEKTRE